MASPPSVSTKTKIFQQKGLSTIYAFTIPRCHSYYGHCGDWFKCWMWLLFDFEVTREALGVGLGVNKLDCNMRVLCKIWRQIGERCGRNRFFKCSQYHCNTPNVTWALHLELMPEPHSYQSLLQAAVAETTFASYFATNNRNIIFVVLLVR